MSFDLSPTPDQQRALDGLDALSDELRELAREVNDSGDLPQDIGTKLSDIIGADATNIAAGTSVLSDPVGLVLLAEKLAWCDAGVAVHVLANAQARLLLRDSGCNADLSTSASLSLAMYESFGRSPSEYRLTATSTADGWVLRGRKESVVGASSAETLVVCARGEDGDPLVFAVPAKSAGVAIERDDRELGKLGLGLAATCAVRFDDVVVPAAALISVGAERLSVTRAINVQRLVLPAIAVGVAQAAVDTTAEWVASRSVRGAPLARNQGVTFPVVDANIATSRARLLVWDLATDLPSMTDATEIERKTGRAVAIGCQVGTDASRTACNTMGWRGL